MTADRAVATLGGGCVADRYRFLAVGPLGTHQMELGAGMHIMAGQTGNAVLFNMTIVEIGCTVTEAVFGSFLFGYQCCLMALKTKFSYRHTKLELEIGGVGSMATEAVIFLNRWVNTLLVGLVIVTFVTDFGTLILYRIERAIALMVAATGIVAGGTLPLGQAAVNKGRIYLAGMALVARFSAYRINSCSRNVRMVIQSTKYCQRESNNHLFHQSHLLPVELVRGADATNNVNYITQLEKMSKKRLSAHAGRVSRRLAPTDR